MNSSKCFSKINIPPHTMGMLRKAQKKNSNLPLNHTLLTHIDTIQEFSDTAKRVRNNGQK